jgi:hypothetical protein
MVGIVSRPISGQTVRNALAQLGVDWKQAKQWIISSNPDYVLEEDIGSFLL